MEGESLDLVQLYDNGLFPCIKEENIAVLRSDDDFSRTFQVICATTMEDDSECVPQVVNSTIFIRPRQWHLLKQTHVLELDRWFSTHGPWRHISEKTVKGLECFNVTVGSFQKRTKDDEVFLTCLFSVQFDFEFYFGMYWCQAVILMEDYDCDVEQCSKQYSTCDYCNKRLICETHSSNYSHHVCVCRKQMVIS